MVLVVSGLGLGVLGLDFRVEGLAFGLGASRVWRFRVRGLQFQPSGLRFLDLGIAFPLVAERIHFTPFGN